MEMSTESSSGSHHHPPLPPGFRFHPTDEELVVHYLKRKAAAAPLPVAIIAEVDLYKHDPWELPAKAAFGEHEWYFFSPRDRKYPNGARPNRAATSGYWKATGTDKPVRSSSAGNRLVGVKKALVFYGGKPPKGVKTNWIMHEYRLADDGGGGGAHAAAGGRGDGRSKKLSLRLDDWVLCRIYQKQGAHRAAPEPETEAPSSAAMPAPYDDTFLEGLLAAAAAKPPELSLVLADVGNRSIGLPYYPGDAGGYYHHHHPAVGAFQLPGVNWGT